MPKAIAPKKKLNKTSEKEFKFVAEYLVDRNATRSAVCAGYKKTSASAQASRLLKKSNVRELIDKGEKALAKRAEVKADEVISELKAIAFSNPMDYWDFSTGRPRIDLSRMTRAQASAISSIKVKPSMSGPEIDIRFHNKVQALEKLGKHVGIFEDKMTHTIEGGATINVVTGISGAVGSRVKERQEKER